MINKIIQNIWRVTFAYTYLQKKEHLSVLQQNNVDNIKYNK